MDEFTYRDEQARRRGHALAALRLRWHQSYGITWDKDQEEYVAARRDGGTVLRDTDNNRLNGRLAVDDNAHPVPPECRVVSLYQ